MNKKMLVHAVVAALAVSTIAYAETLTVVQSNDQQIAAKVEPGANAAQRVLFRNLVTYQGLLLARSNDEAQREAVIVAVNVTHMWTLSPAQQTDVKKNVLQLDAYRPGGGPWDAVRKAPSKVKVLLSISKDQESKINAIEDSLGDSFLQIAQSNLSTEEKFRKHWANEEAIAKKVREVLTTDQRKEFDAIRTEGVKLMDKAFTSRKP